MLTSDSASPAPGAVPQLLLAQLVVGPRGGSQATGEVAGRAGAPPAGEARFLLLCLVGLSAARSHRSPRAVLCCVCVCVVVVYSFPFREAQYQRDQDRLEAEWRRAQRDATGELREEEAEVPGAFLQKV